MSRKGSVNSSGRQVGEVRAAVAAMCSIAATGQTCPVGVVVLPVAPSLGATVPAVVGPVAVATILNSKSAGGRDSIKLKEMGNLLAINLRR